MGQSSPIIDTSNHSAFRLFFLPPGELVEHPADLTTVAIDIPDGPIEGWDAYAPSWAGDGRVVVGPFTPIVSRPYGPNRPAIVVRTSERCWSEYFFGAYDFHDTGRHDRPCWYQSGMTLRFVRKRAGKEGP